MIYHAKDLEGSFARKRYMYYHALGWIPPAIMVGSIYGKKGVVNEGRLANFVTNAPLCQKLSHHIMLNRNLVLD